MRRHPNHRRKSGFTLIELIVVLVIVAIGFSLTGVWMLRAGEKEAGIGPRLRTLRDSAIASGTAVRVQLNEMTSVTFSPDGSATPARFFDGERYWQVDPWTGEVRVVAAD